MLKIYQKIKTNNLNQNIVLLEIFILFIIFTMLTSPLFKVYWARALLIFLELHIRVFIYYIVLVLFLQTIRNIIPI